MSESKDPEAKIPVDAAEARRFVESVLQGNGVTSENAAIVARCLVSADLRGVDTHGYSPLILPYPLIYLSISPPRQF